jgi:hypothetical protein
MNARNADTDSANPGGTGIAACDITPPTSVTVALSFEKIGAQAVL